MVNEKTTQLLQDIKKASLHLGRNSFGRGDWKFEANPSRCEIKKMCLLSKHVNLGNLSH